MKNEKTIDSLVHNEKGEGNFGALVGFAAVCVGAYHGFCDSQNIPFAKENMHAALTYGPALVTGGLGALAGGMSGAVGGGVIGAGAGAGLRRRDLGSTAAGGAVGAAAGGLMGAGIGVVAGGTVGLVATGVGYAMGYGVGYLLR